MLVSRRDEEHAQGALSVDLILQRDEIRGKVTQRPLRADGHHSEVFMPMDITVRKEG